MKRLLVPLLAVVLVAAVSTSPAAPAPGDEAPSAACYPQYENAWVPPESVCA